MKHVIITGGAGFVGSHLCDLFLSHGYSITAVDNFLTGRAENVEHLQGSKNFRLLEWDVSRPIPREKLELLSRDGLFGVLHFACPASPVDFEKIPFSILEVDSLGTIHTVDLALEYKARYIIASTSEIYGDPLEHPQKENYWGNVNTIGPRACYDEAKRFGEAYVSSAIRWPHPKYRSDGRTLNGGIVRIFNTYGPRMRPNDGRVVPELCIQALKGEPLTLHGDGSQTRSFCFVSDLCEGIFRLFESDEKEPTNIGNPVERSVREFADVVKRLTQSKSEIRLLPARPDDPRKRCPDISKAKRVLKWEPRMSLDEGLSQTIEYFKAFVRR